MATNEDVLETLIAKATEHMEKAVKAQRRANDWAEECGVPLPFEIADESTTRPAGGRMTIRADQFGNASTPSGAAREYLEMRGPRLGATPLEDIFDALKRGGFAFNNSKEDVARGGLKVALGKDMNFRKLPNGSWGLWSWYPDVKRKKEESKSEAKGGKAASTNAEKVDAESADEEAETP